MATKGKSKSACGAVFEGDIEKLSGKKASAPAARGCLPFELVVR
ncbi:MAG: hypothetical protein Q4B73_02590 [Lachnospiraceae bacterium]|nr:hypothetical protein [Lachnospiraceae bacterium]